MHRLSITTTFVGMLALTITGCGSGRAENNSNTSSTTVQPTAQPTVKPTDKVEKSAPQTPQKPATPTIVAQNPPTPGFSSAAGLIPPTNANQRTKQVQQGRPDPFAGLFTIPKVVIAKPKVVPIPKPPIKPPQPQPVVVKPTPLPPPAPIQPPQPDLAKGVTVVGVVEVANELQAIVKVPTEATSRYVTVGQRLSDGQVLVKRIEMSPGSEPVVILEQNGIEVTRAVGDEPAAPEEKDKPGKPTAAILSSPLSQTSSPSSSAQFNSLLQNSSTAAIPVPQLPPTKGLKSNSKIEQLPNLPPPPSTGTLPKLESNNNLPEQSAAAVQEPDFPPPAVRTPSPKLESNNYLPKQSTAAVQEPDFPPPAVRTPSPAQQSTNQARIHRQKLIFQLLHSSSHSTGSSAAAKSNSEARTYRQQMISRILNRR